jgi:hypothetical protein
MVSPLEIQADVEVNVKVKVRVGVHVEVQEAAEDVASAVGLEEVGKREAVAGRRASRVAAPVVSSPASVKAETGVEEPVPPLAKDEEEEEEKDKFEVAKGAAAKGKSAKGGASAKKQVEPQPTPDGLILPDLSAFPALNAAMSHMTVDQLKKASIIDTPEGPKKKENYVQALLMTAARRGKDNGLEHMVFPSLHGSLAIYTIAMHCGKV